MPKLSDSALRTDARAITSGPHPHGKQADDAYYACFLLGFFIEDNLLSSNFQHSFYCGSRFRFCQSTDSTICSLARNKKKDSPL